MSAALDALPAGVASLSVDLRILAANRALGELVGRDPSELVGELLDTILTGPSRILFQTHVHPALAADGRVDEVFLTVAAAGGAAVPVLLNAVRAGDAAEDAIAYEAVIVRIRARARWESDLLATTRELERANAESERLAREVAARHAEEQRIRSFRDALIGVVGHELRTPITTIYGMSRILRQRHGSMDPQEAGHLLRDIEDESDRLRRLTEDLLVLSRAEGGRLEVAADPVLLGHVVRGVVNAEQARWPDHAFRVEMAPQLPLVLGEELYVEQVVRNYVGNAAKYSPPGTTVRTALEAQDGGVAVRVIDEGPGLPAGAPDRLFELFFRAPEAARQQAGAGIGLFVCRELVAAMGGRVWASPAPPPAAHGAEFGFWLPAFEEVEAGVRD